MLAIRMRLCYWHVHQGRLPEFQDSFFVKKNCRFLAHVAIVMVYKEFEDDKHIILRHVLNPRNNLNPVLETPLTEQSWQNR